MCRYPSVCIIRQRRICSYTNELCLALFFIVILKISLLETQATRRNNDTEFETTSLIFNNSTRFVEQLVPSDLNGVSCDKFTFEEYRRWTFVYKYDAEDVKKLLCRCRNMCKFYTVPPNISETIREERIDALSDRNKHKFIIVTCILAAIFLLGVSGTTMTLVFLFTSNSNNCK